MNPSKFVIFGVKRVGSNFFISLLNQHPDILCHYEIFHHNAIYCGFGDKSENSRWLENMSLQKRNHSPKKFLDELFTHHHGYTCIGYKFFPNQNENILRYSIADINQKNIIIKRKDILGSYISFKIDRKTGNWSSKDAKEKGINETELDLRIHFNKDEFVQYVQKINHFYNNLENNIALRQNESLVIYYEELLQNQSSVFDKVYDFLGVKRVSVEPKGNIFERQHNGELSKFVINHRQMERFLSEGYHDFTSRQKLPEYLLSKFEKIRPKIKKLFTFHRNKKKNIISNTIPQYTTYKNNVKIDIHIGMEKTGSTSIQAALAMAGEELRKNGIMFSRALNYPSNNYLAVAFQDDNKIDGLRIVNGIAGSEALADFRKRLLCDFIEELRNGDCQRIIVSSEHLSSRLLSINEIKKLKDFFEPFASEISIYIYLRPQADFYISHYSTAVKFEDSIEFFTFPPKRSVREDLFYDRLLAKWEAVYGVEKIHVRTFEQSRLDDNDIVVDFWNWLRLPEKVRPEIKKRNSSLDVKKLEFLRLFNSHIPRFSSGRLNPARGNIAAAIDRIEPLGEKLEIPEREKIKFMTMFEKGNRKIAHEYFGRECLFLSKSTNLYTDSTKKREGKETLGAMDAVKITASLWHMLQEENQHYKNRNDRLTRKIEMLVNSNILTNPYKVWRAYKKLAADYRRHNKTSQP